MSRKDDVKCVVWDLDGTIWDGSLMEGGVRLRPGIRGVIETLDARGILHSVASRNDHADAVAKLMKLGLQDYFLHPQITWGAKSRSIGRILEGLNIQANALLFIDDSPIERDEVNSAYPDVLCVDASAYRALPGYPRLCPRFVTNDARRRRHMYLEQATRVRAEEDFVGPRRAFLASLNLRFTIAEAAEADLRRAHELTVRTNQLNTTGRTYSHDELSCLLSSSRHRVLVCELEDRYGPYGKIGLALIEDVDGCHVIKLLLMSCRVMSLGLGTFLLMYLMRCAKGEGKRLTAEFRPTRLNRAMLVTLKLAKFTVLAETDHGCTLLENDLTMIQPFPPYVHVRLPEEERRAFRGSD